MKILWKTGLWILLLFIFHGMVSCKKDNSEPTPVQEYVDPELTPEEEKVLAESSTSVTSILDSLFDENGTSLRTVFSRPGWENHLDSVIRFGRKATAPTYKQIVTDRFNMALYGTAFCYYNEDPAHCRDSVSPIQPKQMAFAYVAGSRQLERAALTEHGNAEHRKYKLLGTDCSGLVYLLFKINGYSNISNFNVASMRGSLNSAVKAKYDGKAEIIELGNIPKEKMKKGDVIVWPHHTGLVQGDGNVQVILQSNGRFVDPTPAQQRENFVFKPAEDTNRKGINAKKLSYMVNPGRWSGNYSILRIFQIPYNQKAASGSGQTAGLGQPLPNPIVVQITDKGGDPVPDVKVNFEVTDGDGELLYPNVVTDLSGFATNYWTLGTTPGSIQKVEAVAVDFHGKDLPGYAYFLAYVNSSFSCPASVTDVEGNTYPVIRIGDQCWMKENLKTGKYRNGDPIPKGLNNEQWAATHEGACSVYDELGTNESIYGKIYNVYAILDPRGLCPVGWHVPKHSEWVTLENSLGGQSDTLVGGKMKTTYLWESPNVGATNSSGFTGLPAGIRYFDGTFHDLGKTTTWASSVENVGQGGYWSRYLRSDKSKLYWGAYGGSGGVSVRCIKN